MFRFHVKLQGCSKDICRSVAYVINYIPENSHVTCPLNMGPFQKEHSLPNIIFQGLTLGFGGVRPF